MGIRCCFMFLIYINILSFNTLINFCRCYRAACVSKRHKTFSPVTLADAHTFIHKLKKNCHPAKNAPLFVKRKQNPIRVFVRGPVQILKKRRSTPRLFTRPRTKFRETAFFSILLWTKFLRGDSSSLTCV